MEKQRPQVEGARCAIYQLALLSRVRKTLLAPMPIGGTEYLEL